MPVTKSAAAVAGGTGYGVIAGSAPCMYRMAAGAAVGLGCGCEVTGPAVAVAGGFGVLPPGVGLATGALGGPVGLVAATVAVYVAAVVESTALVYGRPCVC